MKELLGLAIACFILGGLLWLYTSWCYRQYRRVCNAILQALDEDFRPARRVLAEAECRLGWRIRPQTFEEIMTRLEDYGDVEGRWEPSPQPRCREYRRAR